MLQTPGSWSFLFINLFFSFLGYFYFLGESRSLETILVKIF